MDRITEQLGLYGLIPVVKIDDADDAEPLAKALIEGGLPVAEITFRTEAAEEAIRRTREAYPDMLTGAGTVINRSQAGKALAAGAQFIVSPGLNRDTVEFCRENGLPVIPGVATPSEIQEALEMGLEVLKFFPAEALGGLSTLKAVSAPLSGVKFVPLGGINRGNLNDYLSSPKVFACGGTWMVKDSLIKEAKFDEITRLTGEAVVAMLGFEIARVEINEDGAPDSMETAKAFSSMFGASPVEGAGLNFAGTAIEVNKLKCRGRNGHIAVRTNDIRRAVFYLSRKGVEAEMETAEKSPAGDMAAVHLKEEIGGFAIRLVQKNKGD